MKKEYKASRNYNSKVVKMINTIASRRDAILIISHLRDHSYIPKKQNLCRERKKTLMRLKKQQRTRTPNEICGLVKKLF